MEQESRSRSDSDSNDVTDSGSNDVTDSDSNVEDSTEKSLGSSLAPHSTEVLCPDAKPIKISTTESDGRKSNKVCRLSRIAKKFEAALKQVTIEPIIFSYIVALTLQGTLTTNLLLDKVCEIHFQYGAEVCTNLTANPPLEDQVQTIVSQYNMYLKLIQNIPTIFFLLFLGPWSDTNGRKLPMILPFIGCLLGSMICMMNSYFWWLSPEHILMSAVPRAMTGGFTTLMMASYSYISDLSKDRSRTTRIALLDMMFIISPPLGMCLSNVLYQSIGYTGVYAVSLFIYFSSIVYIAYFIKDTKGVFSEMYLPDSPKVKLFDVGNVKETVLVCVRSGEHRTKILFLMSNICLMSIIFGCTGMEYLYTQKKFSWTFSQYVQLATIQLILNGIGTSIILPFLSYCLKAEDLLLAVLGCLSKISGSLVQAFAFKPWHLYAAAAVALVGGTPLSVTRSKISKLVSPNELGKIFSMLASWESIVPLVSNPLYTFTYNATMDVFPGAIFVISGLVFTAAALIFLTIHCSNSPDPTRHRLPSA